MMAPLPESATLLTGLRGSLEETVNTALLLPVNIGWNVKVTVQNPFVDNGDVQSFVCMMNSEPFVPAMLILLIARSDVPKFLIVTALGEEVPPAGTDPKLTDIGNIEIFGGGALPESVTYRFGFLGSLEETVMPAFF